MRARSTLTVILVTLTAVTPIVVLGVDSKRDPVTPIRPDCNIVDRSAAIVKSIVGDEFFSQYLQFRTLELLDTRGIDVVRMERDGGNGRTNYKDFPEVYYEVQWLVRFPFGGAPQGVHFRMDPSGRLISDPDEIRLPPCAQHPELCSFAVTREEAGNIGLKATNTNGTTWAYLIWSEDFSRYLWVVRILPAGVQPDQTCTACKMALVDPNTGEVLMSGDWKEQHRGWE